MALFLEPGELGSLNINRSWFSSFGHADKGGFRRSARSSRESLVIAILDRGIFQQAIEIYCSRSLAELVYWRSLLKLFLLALPETRTLKAVYPLVF